MGALRRYLRFNATQKGLFGGSQFWLAVWAAGSVRRALRRFENREPTVDFSRVLGPGETVVVSQPAPRAKNGRRNGDRRGRRRRGR